MATLTMHMTINEAATTTGWSPRMLRYVEQLGLVDAPRSPAGYRLYGPAELQRLRTLRALLQQHGVELGDVGFALRLRREPELATAGWARRRPSTGFFGTKPKALSWRMTACPRPVFSAFASSCCAATASIAA